MIYNKLMFSCLVSAFFFNGYATKANPIISLREEIENDTPLGRIASSHIRAAQQDPGHISIIQRELLPVTTGAITLHNSDVRIKVKDASGNIVEGDSNLERFQRARQTMEANGLRLPADFTKECFFGRENTDGVNSEIRYKKPALAARQDLLVERERVNVQNFQRLVEGACIVPDATRLTLEGNPTKNGKVFFTGAFSIDTILLAEGQDYTVIQESFSDDHNIEGAPHEGVFGTQQEPFSMSNPELLPAATVLRLARATLPNSRPSKNDQGVRMEFNEIHAYSNYVVQYDGKFNPVESALEKRKSAILVEAASIDCREPNAKPEDHSEYVRLVRQKRDNVMKVAAHMAPPGVKTTFSTGLPGLGVFENEVKPTVSAMQEALTTYGHYFDVIIFAGLKELSESDAKKAQDLIASGQEDSTMGNRTLCGTYLMLDMLKNTFDANKLPESF